jgi:plastocyanin
VRLLLLASVCASVVACGGSTRPIATPAPSPAATGNGSVVQVGMRHNRFGPARVVVRLGQAVRWTNHDAVAHTVAAASLRLSSEAIRPGETFSYRPRRAGRLAYYCTIHAGQTGILVVR